MPLRLFSPRRVLNFLDVILFQIWRTLCPRCLKVSETAFWNKKLAIFLLELKEFCSPHVRSEFGLGCSHSDWVVLKLLGLSKANVHIGTLHGLTSAAGSHAEQTLLEVPPPNDKARGGRDGELFGKFYRSILFILLLRKLIRLPDIALIFYKFARHVMFTSIKTNRDTEGAVRDCSKLSK